MIRLSEITKVHKLFTKKLQKIHETDLEC